MGCLSSTRITEINNEITVLSTRLTSLETAYTSALSGGIESYTLDSGDGSQRVKYRSLTDLQKAIDATQSRINTLRALLRGTGIVNTTLRRK